ncbi:MAG: hypothetical protein Q9157_004180 [Trypethelium eluteriae]
MALHWGGAYIKHWPEEIQQDLSSAHNDPNAVMTEEQEHTIPMVNGKTGDRLFRIAADSTRRVSRTKLRLLLSRGIDVQYGKKLLRVDEHHDTITAHFEDGSSAEGTCLVGCDGVRSTVRNFLLPPEEIKLRHIPVTVFNLTQTFTAEQAKFIRSFDHPWIMISPHPSQDTMALLCLADINDADNPETWVFQLLYSKWVDAEPAATNEERLAQLKEMSQSYCEPFKSAAMWIRDDTYIHPDRMKDWPNPPKWNNHGGRATLAGDAAHPMAPCLADRGQGLNNALEDAARYVSILADVHEGKQSLPDAISAYDDEMRMRGATEIDVTWKNAYALHHFDALMDSPIAKHGVTKFNDKKA